MSESIIKPLRPAGHLWRGPIPLPPQITLGYEGYAWQNTEHNLQVFSCVEVAQDKDGISRGPEYHVSISKRIGGGNPTRASTAEVSWVLHQFGDMSGWEEDNHVPGGVVRNFWRPVAEPLIGMECACKADEPAMVEDKGEYVWRP
jgi:hypothetical protein